METKKPTKMLFMSPGTMTGYVLQATAVIDKSTNEMKPPRWCVIRFPQHIGGALQAFGLKESNLCKQEDEVRFFTSYDR